MAPPTPGAVKDAVESAVGAVDAVAREAATTEAAETASVEVGGGSAAAAEETKHEPDKQKKGWIEIVLKDEEDTPQGGARYRITLPDGSVADGTLDHKGKARVDGFDPGACKVEFPDLDEKVWNPK